MISLEQAKSIIESKFKGAKAEAAYKYGDKFYLIMAPSGRDDANDPFYLVDIGSGKYRFLNPLEDIDKFNDAMENGPIKTFVESETRYIE